MKRKTMTTVVKIKPEHVKLLELTKERTKQSFQGQVELALDNWFKMNMENTTP